MHFTKSLMTAAASLVLTLNPALAIDAWTGSKTFVHFDFDRIVPIVVDMNEKHGTVSISDGADAGHGTATMTSTEISIHLSLPITSVGFPFAFNPYTGNVEQIETTKKVDAFTITEVTEDSFEFQSSGEICRNYFIPGEPRRIECEPMTDNYEENVFQIMSERTVQTQISEGDKVTLPSSQLDTAYVKLLANDQVENLIPDSEGVEIKTLKRKKGKLVANLKDGNSITFTRLAKRTGNELLLGLLRDQYGLLLAQTAGTIVVDENVNSSVLNFTGSYNVVGFGGLYTDGDEFIINFLTSGFGGFDYYDPATDSTRATRWSWKQTPTGMKASRWMKVDEFGGFMGMANTESEIQECLSQKVTCREFQKREYTLLAKDGNKYTMLRRMEQNLPNSDSSSISYSVNYLYKK